MEETLEVVGTEPIEQPSSGEGEVQPEATQSQEDDDPYSPKTSKEFSKALKAWREANPEAAKFARIAKDDHARLYELKRLEQRGIDGVREKYAILDSIVHGELKGIEALSAIQDEIRNVAEIDEYLAAGDPRALDALGDGFSEGLAKLTPTILDRVRESNPEAYAAAVLPHFVEALKESELVQNFNGMVDVLNEAPPTWLSEDQKAQWINDRLNRVVALAGKMGAWFNAQAQKAIPLSEKRQVDPSKDLNDERAQFETERQKAHWENNIQPGLDRHANQKFQELFQPYAKRLRLDSGAISSLKQSFVQGVVQSASGNKAYMDQISRYWSQKSPDPKTVVNFAKVEFDRHAKTVMNKLVNERYKPFLNGRPKPQVSTNATATSSAKSSPVSPGVQIVAVKPPSDQIDFKGTPLEWLHQRKYKLTSGKVVQVRQ